MALPRRTSLRGLALSLILTAAATLAQPAAMGADMNLRLLLPPEIPAVPGREVNVYFDNVLLYPRPDLLLYEVDCAKGLQQVERFTWTPTAEEVGPHPLSLKVYDLAGALLAEGQTTIRVYPPDAGAGQSLSVLIIGASLTAATIYPEELLNLMRQPGNPRLTLIGSSRPRPGDPAVRHEGYGGWRAVHFASRWEAQPLTQEGRRARSPFIFEQDGRPTFNFQRYLDEQHGGQAPDVITILLGCNDNFSAKDDTIEASIDEFVASLDLLITEFHKVRPDTRLALLSLIPPAATQDAFGASYGCGQTRWQYKKNQHRVMERMVEKYGHREVEHIHLVPVYLNLDTLLNFPRATAPANARAEAADHVRLCNGCHPSPAGYRQIADSLYCWMKGQLAD